MKSGPHRPRRITSLHPPALMRPATLHKWEHLPSELKLRIISFTDIVKDSPARDILPDRKLDTFHRDILCCGSCNIGYTDKFCLCESPRLKRGRCGCRAFSHAILAANRELRILGLDCIYRHTTFEIGPFRMGKRDSLLLREVVEELDVEKLASVRNLDILLWFENVCGRQTSGSVVDFDYLRSLSRDEYESWVRRKYIGKFSREVGEWATTLQLLNAVFLRRDVSITIKLVVYDDDEELVDTVGSLLGNVAAEVGADNIRFETASDREINRRWAAGRKQANSPKWVSCSCARCAAHSPDA